MASSAAGYGLQQLLPIVVRHELDERAVGHYRVVVSMTGTYLGFVVSALTQEFLPRISSLASDRSAIARAVDDQVRLVLIVVAPAILGAMTFGRWMLRILYTPDFVGALPTLEWALLADVPRFLSWTGALVIVGRMPARTYLWTELAGGVISVAGAIAGARLGGLPGVGAASAVTYCVYAAIVFAVVHRHCGFLPSRGTVAAAASVGIAASIVLGLVALAPTMVATACGSLLVIVAAAFAWTRVVASAHAIGWFSRADVA
jgi:PST family polysaccharide transporter